MSLAESPRLAYPPAAEAFWIGQAELAAERVGDDALQRMTPAVAHLSDLFTTERPDHKFPDYFADPRLLAAYGIFFLPQSFTRTSFALAQICGLRGWRLLPMLAFVAAIAAINLWLMAQDMEMRF